MKTKKILHILFLLFAILFASCEKDEPDTLIPSQITIKVGQNYDLASEQSWQSSNSFVANVANSGIIKGLHVGNCTVACSKGSCNVTVLANINLFQDPITQWGLSKSQVINKVGYNYQETTNGDLAYETGNSIAPYVAYNFSNNTLSSVLLMVKTAYTNQIIDHLSERYQFITTYESEKSFIFLNGNSLSESSTMVILKLYNSSYWVVCYSKN